MCLEGYLFNTDKDWVHYFLVYSEELPLVNKGIKYIMPKVSKASTVVKPHLTSAAKDVTSDVMKDVGEKISSVLTPHEQEGAGLRHRKRIKRKTPTHTQSLLKTFYVSKKSNKKSKKIKIYPLCHNGIYL